MLYSNHAIPYSKLAILFGDLAMSYGKLAISFGDLAIPYGKLAMLFGKDGRHLSQLKKHLFKPYSCSILIIRRKDKKYL